MANRPDITAQELRELLRYDPDAGQIFWRQRPSDTFKTSAAAKTWNGRFAGKAALTAVSDTGYLTGCIHYRSVSAHRVAWALFYGRWPQEIDHINGDRADNRIANLREVTRRTNNRNHGPDSRNKSGYTGVYWNKQQQKWHAKVRVDGRDLHLGFFDDVHSAGAARTKAAEALGFTERHNRRHASRPRSS